MSTPDDSDGQVSQVQKMDPDDTDTPIDDSQGVAGNPEAPGPGEVKEAGPNANPHRDEHTH